MEFLFVTFNLSTLVLLSSFIFLLIIQWIIPSKSKSKSPKSTHKNTNMPPSPPRLPIIGHLHHLMAGNLPHRVLATISRKYGPIVHLQIGEVSTVLLSSPEAAKEILKNQDPVCADRPVSVGTKIMWRNGFIVSPYGEFWRQMRKICMQEMLSAKSVKSFDSIRKDETFRLIDSARSSVGEPFNLSKKLFLFSSSMISRIAVGKVMKRNEELIDLMREGITVAGWFELADMFPSWKLLNLLSWNKNKLLLIKRKIDAILQIILEEHKNSPTNGEYGSEDLIDVFARVNREGKFDFPITNDNIRAIIYDLFSAGTDTVSSTTDWAMAELMRNPDAMKKVQKEVREVLKGKETIEENDLQQLTYLKHVIKETLRLHPPVPLLARSCRYDCEIEGYSIPANTKVITNAWGMARDPKYWDEPEAFRPERFEKASIDFVDDNFNYVPFGVGRRMCPGATFGLANMMLPLSQILYHFDWEMPKGMVREGIDMTEELGLTVPRKSPLVLVPRLYVG